MVIAEILTYLESKGWTYQRSADGHTLTLPRCPLCGQTTGFSVTVRSGVWRCKACERFGTLLTLKRLAGDLGTIEGDERPLNVVVPEEKIEALHAALLRDDQIVTWLEKRLIRDEDIRSWRLGLSVEEGGRWVVFPYVAGDTVVNAHLLEWREEGFGMGKWLNGEAKGGHVFGSERLEDSASRSVILFGSEVDVIAANAFGVKGGVFLSRWEFGSEIYDWFEQFERVFVCWGDRYGPDALERLAGRLGPERCFPVLYPRDCGGFQAYLARGASLDDVRGLLKTTKPMADARVVSVGGVIDKLYEEYQNQQTDRFVWPWPGVKRIMGRVRPGDMIVVTAKPQTGKTTFCVQTAIANAKAGASCLVYCLEMSDTRLMYNISRSELMKKDIGQDDLLYLKGTMAGLPLYFCGMLGKGHDGVYDTIRYARRRHGVEVVVLDNLHFLCRSVEHIVADVGRVSRDLKMLAMELGIVIMVVAHPKKMSDKEIPGLYAARDSSSVAGDADLQISLYRKSLQRECIQEEDWDTETMHTMDPWMLVRVSKGRYTGGGQTKLYFVEDFSRILSPDEMQREPPAEESTDDERGSPV